MVISLNFESSFFICIISLKFLYNLLWLYLPIPQLLPEPLLLYLSDFLSLLSLSPSTCVAHTCLDVWPSSGCSQLTRDYVLVENWLSFSQELWMTNSSLARNGSAHFPPPCWGFVWLEIIRACAWCHNLWGHKCGSRAMCTRHGFLVVIHCLCHSFCFLFNDSWLGGESVYKGPLRAKYSIVLILCSLTTCESLC